MRLVICLALSLLAGCAVVRQAGTRTPPGDPVADGVSVLRGSFVPGTQPDGNSVLLRGTNGLIVVDTGRHVRHTTRILDAAQATGRPVVAIVNTHWHLDHVAGNVLLRQVFPRAEVHASNAMGDALQGFLADYRMQLKRMIMRPANATPEDLAAWREEVARIDAGQALLPTQPLTVPQDLSLDGRRLHFGLEANAVSGGDVWLFDPASRTLIAGDLVTLPVPLFDTACSEGWRKSLAELDAIDFVQLVPGHGAPMNHAQFRDYRGAFDRLLACAASDAHADTCKAGWLRDAGALIATQDVALANSLLDYYINQVLRAPAERRARYCHKETTS